MSISGNELDLTQKSPTSMSMIITDEEFEEDDDIEGGYVSILNDSNELLKTSAVLFEFLSSPDLCKTISKRERNIMEKVLSKIYVLSEKLDELLDSED